MLLCLTLTAACATTGGLPGFDTDEAALAALNDAAQARDAAPLPGGWAELPAELRAFYEELSTTVDPAALLAAARGASVQPPPALGGRLVFALPPAGALPDDAGAARVVIMESIFQSLRILDLRAPPAPRVAPAAGRPDAVRVAERLAARTMRTGTPAEAIVAAWYLAQSALERGEADGAVRLLTAAERLGPPAGEIRPAELLPFMLFAAGAIEAGDERVIAAGPREDWTQARRDAVRRSELLGAAPSAERERDLAIVETKLGMWRAALRRVDDARLRWPDDARLVDLRFVLATFERGLEATQQIEELLAALHAPIADAQSWDLRAYALCTRTVHELNAADARGEARSRFVAARAAFAELRRAETAFARENEPLLRLLELEDQLLAALLGEGSLDLVAFANDVVRLTIRAPACGPCWAMAFDVVALADDDVRPKLLLETMPPAWLAGQSEFRVVLLGARLDEALTRAFLDAPMAERLRVAALDDAPEGARAAAKALADASRAWGELLAERSSLASTGATLVESSRAALERGAPGGLRARLLSFLMVGHSLRGDPAAAAEVGLTAFPNAGHPLPARAEALFAAAAAGGARTPIATELRAAIAQHRALNSTDLLAGPLRLATFHAERLEGLRPTRTQGAFAAELPKPAAFALALGVGRAVTIGFDCRVGVEPPGRPWIELGPQLEASTWPLSSVSPGAVTLNPPAPAK